MLPDKYYIKDITSYFDKTNFLQKESDTCPIILNYNNKPLILELAVYLKELNCDILIVDNCSSDGSYEELYNRYNKRFNLIRTNNNYGGAGGFSIGIQWSIERDYKYCFANEEDALPLKVNEDIFKEMLKYKNSNLFQKRTAIGVSLVLSTVFAVIFLPIVTFKKIRHHF